MATSMPKSYQATISHNGSSESFTGPHTFTDRIFRVPAGKTWLVIKMMMRIPPPTKQVSSFRIEKASNSGSEQMVLLNIVAEDDHPALSVDESGIELNTARDLVLEDQELIRQSVKVPGPGIPFTMQYEISVMEYTP